MNNVSVASCIYLCHELRFTTNKNPIKIYNKSSESSDIIPMIHQNIQYKFKRKVQYHFITDSYSSSSQQATHTVGKVPLLRIEIIVIGCIRLSIHTNTYKYFESIPYSSSLLNFFTELSPFIVFSHQFIIFSNFLNYHIIFIDEIIRKL